MSAPSTPRNQIIRAPLAPPPISRPQLGARIFESPHQKQFLAEISMNSTSDRGFNREVSTIMNQPLFSPKAVETPPPRVRRVTPFCVGF
jgi:hypothetical protein